MQKTIFLGDFVAGGQHQNFGSEFRGDILVQKAPSFELLMQGGVALWGCLMVGGSSLSIWGVRIFAYG